MFAFSTMVWRQTLRRMSSRDCGIVRLSVLETGAIGFMLADFVLEAEGRHGRPKDEWRRPRCGDDTWGTRARAPAKKEKEQRFLATLGMTELALNKTGVESYGLSGVRTTIGGVVTW